MTEIIKIRKCLYLVLFILSTAIGLNACTDVNEPLVVYSGKGLKKAMDEVEQVFEQQHGIPVEITYAGSNSLLKTLLATHKGDVFLPGSVGYIKKLGDLAVNPQYVARHTPGFIVRKDTTMSIDNYNDLLKPGVRIAIGNKDTCAIGKVGNAILMAASTEQSFQPNVVVSGSTVNELYNMVKDAEVDAALVWKDMVKWPYSNNLKYVALPEHLNKKKEIWVTALSVSTAPEKANLFADFVASASGQSIFQKHGFGEK